MRKIKDRSRIRSIINRILYLPWWRNWDYADDEMIVWFDRKCYFVQRDIICSCGGDGTNFIAIFGNGVIAMFPNVPELNKRYKEYIEEKLEQEIENILLDE